MSWNDAKYDNWRLASPYDNDNEPEVFWSEKHDVFTCDEDAINAFEYQIDLAAKDASIYTENICDNLEEYKEILIDELELDSDNYGAIERAHEAYNDAKEYAAECKYQQMKDDKLTGDA